MANSSRVLVALASDIAFCRLTKLSFDQRAEAAIDSTMQIAETLAGRAIQTGYSIQDALSMKASIGSVQRLTRPSVTLRLPWPEKMMWIDHEALMVTASTQAVGLPVSQSAMALPIQSRTSV